jgi:hypothetical protein
VLEHQLLAVGRVPYSVSQSPFFALLSIQPPLPSFFHDEVGHMDVGMIQIRSVLANRIEQGASLLLIYRISIMIHKNPCPCPDICSLTEGRVNRVRQQLIGLT